MSVELNENLALGVCPVCQSRLYARDVAVHTFNCPHCGEALMPDRGRTYFWFRFLFILWRCVHLGMASLARFIHDFTVGIYAIPLVFVWFDLERMHLPPRKFKRPECLFTTLGI